MQMIAGLARISTYCSAAILKKGITSRFYCLPTVTQIRITSSTLMERPVNSGFILQTNLWQRFYGLRPSGPIVSQRWSTSQLYVVDIVIRQQPKSEILGIFLAFLKQRIMADMVSLFGDI